MEDDLGLATGILLRHAAASGGTLPLLEALSIPDDPEGKATVVLPEWWFEIITAFRDLHEPAEAEYRRDCREIGGVRGRNGYSRARFPVEAEATWSGS